MACICINMVNAFTFRYAYIRNGHAKTVEQCKAEQQKIRPCAFFPNVFAIFLKKKVGMRWFFRFCISKWFWGFHLTQQQKQRSGHTESNDDEKSSQVFHSADLREPPIFVNKFHILANERKKNIPRTTFWWCFESLIGTKKSVRTYNSNGMAFGWWNTLYDFGSPNISSRENWICDNDNWCGGRFSVVLFDFFLVCLPFFTIWFKSSLVDYCGKYLTRTVGCR